jgi:hypothetical protein
MSVANLLTVTDTGWDMGLEEDLKTYWDERQNELG